VGANRFIPLVNREVGVTAGREVTESCTDRFEDTSPGRAIMNRKYLLALVAALACSSANAHQVIVGKVALVNDGDTTCTGQFLHVIE